MSVDVTSFIIYIFVLICKKKFQLSREICSCAAIREGAEDVYADAKEINRLRAEEEAAAVIEDKSEETVKA